MNIKFKESCVLNEIQVNEYDKAVNFAVMCGRIMLQSGAETSRVEDTVIRILARCNYKLCDSFVTTTGIFATISDKEKGTITLFRSVNTRSNNLEKIALANDVSRNFVAGKISLNEGIEMLEKIKKVKDFPLYLKLLASSLASFSFAFIFGGNLSDCIGAAITGFILQIVLGILTKNNVPKVLVNIFGGSSISISALLLANIGLCKGIDNIIIGAIMLLVPGVLLTNAFRDILDGDFLSGTTRLLDTLIIGVAITVGIGTTIRLWVWIFGGVII